MKQDIGWLEKYEEFRLFKYFDKCGILIMVNNQNQTLSGTLQIFIFFIILEL